MNQIKVKEIEQQKDKNKINCYKQSNISEMKNYKTSKEELLQ